jgi:NAD(P)-dependent dehydrogenase (short-subunit alcohol dehydrogenase family)
VDLHLSNKIVLITGGSKGLGRAMAHRFAAEGCHLHLVARTQATLDETADALRQQFPVTVKTLAVDLAQRGSAQHVADTCDDVDILVNNAGDIPSGSLEMVDEERWRAGWDTKVFAYINLSREYFRRMKARRSGVIINVTGIGGDLLDPGYIAGGVGNAAMAAFTKSLGASSHAAGVRVVGINPGPCATERFERLARAKAQEKYGDSERWREATATLPFGRPATPDEIAAATVFLASPLSAYTTGTILTIDGGITGGREIPR